MHIHGIDSFRNRILQSISWHSHLSHDVTRLLVKNQDISSFASYDHVHDLQAKVLHYSFATHSIIIFSRLAIKK